jgi:CheY-like chemotaxis protein
VTVFSGGAGAGATFRVSLPLMMVQPPVIRQDERGLTQSVPYPSPRVRLDGIRVLAVDDQEDALGVLRLILETAGARVTTVGSGARALDVLRTEAQDALIADIGMPHMDGLELIRMVRQSLPYPANRVPAAALTAYARAEDRVTALASGFQMHLAKPVNAAELVVAVAALVGRPE